MKKILILSLFISFLFNSCDLNEDSLNTAKRKLNELIDGFKNNQSKTELNEWEKVETEEVRILFDDFYVSHSKYCNGKLWSQINFKGL